MFTLLYLKQLKKILKKQKSLYEIIFIKTKMAVPTGIEPAISCVTGRHVNRYTTGPFLNSLYLSWTVIIVTKKSINDNSFFKIILDFLLYIRFLLPCTRSCLLLSIVSSLYRVFTKVFMPHEREE